MVNGLFSYVVMVADSACWAYIGQGCHMSCRSAVLVPVTIGIYRVVLHPVLAANSCLDWIYDAVLVWFLSHGTLLWRLSIVLDFVLDFADLHVAVAAGFLWSLF
jgi:hypothetical protein